jgi:endonuclease YncB( thermonuclease family)
MPLSLVAISLLLLFVTEYKGEASFSKAHTNTHTSAISCRNPYITDGDTLRCNGIRIRLAGIDAPEMPGHCQTGRKCTPGNPYAAKDYLYEISRGKITCHPIEQDRYNRTVAECYTEKVNLSCAMIDKGHAVRRYRPIDC